MGFIDKIKAMFGMAATPERDSDPQPRLLSAAPTAPAVVTSVVVVTPEPEPLTGVDFPRVRVAAGVAPAVHDLVVKAQELLRTLPSDTPAATKLRIVQAAFNAFGVSIESIVDAASREVKALAEFIDTGESNTDKIRIEGAKRIADLEAEIAKVNASVELAVANHAARASETQDEILRVQPVLMFFAQEKAAAAPVAAAPVAAVFAPPSFGLESTDLDEEPKSPPPRPVAKRPGAPGEGVPRGVPRG